MYYHLMLRRIVKKFDEFYQILLQTQKKLKLPQKNILIALLNFLELWEVMAQEIEKSHVLKKKEKNGLKI